ncbi:MAG: hypothetical protein HC906_04310 [Bacteroidales bacterium]|nr:hypothetical protein [Bacteroidales bacterium]
MSYVEQPIQDMGREAVNILVDLINGSEKMKEIKLKQN